MSSVSTVTAAPSLDYVNLGPLTTTFTAPSSCSTQGLRVGLAPDNAFWRAEWAVNDCELASNTVGDCLPSGGAIDEAYAAYLDSDNPDDVTGPRYYSPGLHCPLDWATVGVASRDGDAEVTGDGVFSARTLDPGVTYRFAALTADLGPSETAVACCPSGYEADDIAGCVSYFPLTELAHSTVCQLQLKSDVSISNVPYTKTVDGIVTTDSYPTPIFTGPWTRQVRTYTYVLDDKAQAYTNVTGKLELFPGPSATGVSTAEYIIIRHGGNDTAGEGEKEEEPAEVENAAAARGSWTVGFAALAGVAIGAVAFAL